MNQQEYNEWRERNWRHRLTASEEAELQKHLAGHPADREDWQVESDLSQLLERLPDAPPVSSNFTSLVLRAVEQDAAVRSRERAVDPFWRIIKSWLPRAAAAGLVLGFLSAGYYQHEANSRAQLARNVAGFARAISADPELMKDFDSINRLSDPQPSADTELIALMK